MAPTHTTTSQHIALFEIVSLLLQIKLLANQQLNEMKYFCISVSKTTQTFVKDNIFARLPPIQAPANILHVLKLFLYCQRKKLKMIYFRSLRNQQSQCICPTPDFCQDRPFGNLVLFLIPFYLRLNFELELNETQAMVCECMYESSPKSPERMRPVNSMKGFSAFQPLHAFTDPGSHFHAQFRLRPPWQLSF